MKCQDPKTLPKRQFLKTCLGATMACVGPVDRGACQVVSESIPSPIVDLHQHTLYSGRNNQQLMQHQEAMGVDLTVLLPAGKVADWRLGVVPTKRFIDFPRFTRTGLCFLPMRCGPRVGR